MNSTDVAFVATHFWYMSKDEAIKLLKKKLI